MDQGSQLIPAALKTDSWPSREGRPRAHLAPLSKAPRRGTSPKGAAPAPDRPHGLALWCHQRAAHIADELGWHKVPRSTVAAPAPGPALARLALHSNGGFALRIQRIAATHWANLAASQICLERVAKLRASGGRQIAPTSLLRRDQPPAASPPAILRAAIRRVISTPVSCRARGFCNKKPVSIPIGLSPLLRWSLLFLLRN